MEKNKQIAYFTTNTDLFTNSTIIAFFRTLQRNNISVLLFAPESLVEFPPDIRNFRHYSAPHPLIVYPRRPLLILSTLYGYVKVFVLLKIRGIKIVIGQDASGLIIANRLNKVFRFLQIHYFSFEIYFEDEPMEDYHRRMKRKERLASPCATDILIQDEMRRQLLMNEIVVREGAIWHLIPVAPVDIRAGEKVMPAAWPHGLDVPAGKVLLIHSGTIEAWSGMDILLAALENNWPGQYWLVIHTFEQLNDQHPVHRKLLNAKKNNRPITLYSHVFVDEQRYYSFLKHFDAGIAFYVGQNKGGIGRNVSEIGFASGKFATFMMLGIPVITTANASFVSLAGKYDFGYVLNSESALTSLISDADFSDPKFAGETRRLYTEVLDPSSRLEILVQRIAGPLIFHGGEN